jgi:hypothetical protein
MLSFPAKLNSSHDLYYLHKVLALYCLGHFCICLSPLYSYWIQWAPFWIRILSVLTHLLLGCSSFIFKIPRNRTSLYTIFRELQLHNILFTIRSVVIWSFLTFSLSSSWVRLGFVLLIHVLADVITRFFAPENGGTLIRRKPRDEQKVSIPKKDDRSQIDKVGRFCSSFSQLAATWSCLFDSNPRTQIGILFGIQIGAFAATLVRKGLLTSFQSAVFYQVSLLVGWIIKFLAASSSQDFIIRFVEISLVSIFRFRFSINKYFLWTGIFLYHQFVKS